MIPKGKTVQYLLHTLYTKNAKAHTEKSVSVRKRSLGQTQSSETPCKSTGGWTGSKSREFTASNKWMGSISFAFHYDSGIPCYCIPEQMKRHWFYQSKAIDTKILAWNFHPPWWQDPESSIKAELPISACQRVKPMLEWWNPNMAPPRIVCAHTRHWEWMNIHRVSE